MGNINECGTYYQEDRLGNSCKKELWNRRKNFLPKHNKKRKEESNDTKFCSLHVSIIRQGMSFWLIMEMTKSKHFSCAYTAEVESMDQLVCGRFRRWMMGQDESVLFQRFQNSGSQLLAKNDRFHMFLIHQTRICNMIEIAFDTVYHCFEKKRISMWEAFCMLFTSFNRFVISYQRKQQVLFWLAVNIIRNLESAESIQLFFLRIQKPLYRVCFGWSVPISVG